MSTLRGNLVDLRIAKLEAGAWWEILDVDDPSVSNYVEVVGLDDSVPDTKVLVVRVMISNIKHEAGTEITYTLSSKGTMVLGRQCKSADEEVEPGTLVDELAYGKNICLTLVQYLRTCKASRYSKKVREAIAYLTDKNFFDKSQSYATQKRILIKYCKQYAKGAVAFNGEYVKLINLSAFDATKQTVLSQPGAGTLSETREVDFIMFCEGWKKILESGALGNIKLKF